MLLETQLINSTYPAGTYAKWVAPRSGTCQIQCYSRVTWPASLVLDVKVSNSGVSPQYPSGFTSLQFTANGICAPFYVRAGTEIFVPVNVKSSTETEVELTPSIE